MRPVQWADLAAQDSDAESTVPAPLDFGPLNEVVANIDRIIFKEGFHGMQVGASTAACVARERSAMEAADARCPSPRSARPCEAAADADFCETVGNQLKKNKKKQKRKKDAPAKPWAPGAPRQPDRAATADEGREAPQAETEAPQQEEEAPQLEAGSDQVERMARFWAARVAEKRAEDLADGSIVAREVHVERVHRCSWCSGKSEAARLECSAWVPRNVWSFARRAAERPGRLTEGRTPATTRCTWAAALLAARAAP